MTLALPKARIYGSPVRSTRRLLALVPNGEFFALADGTRFTMIEASFFNGLGRFDRREDIRPALHQLQDLGFNTVRVWTLMQLAQFGIGDLLACPYDKIQAFVALCAEYGLYVEFTAYTGINDPDHWDRLWQASIHADPWPLLELVNEDDQNHEPDASGRVLDVHRFRQAPTPILSSHGSNGTRSAPVRPPWSYETYHDNDADQWMREPHNAREFSVGADGVPASHAPVLVNESRRPDRDGVVSHFHDHAACAALLCAGSCFHSQAGKAAQLLTGHQLDCAIAHVAGAMQPPTFCQPFDYRHRSDLERPDAGQTGERAYQRGLADECIVHIRP